MTLLDDLQHHIAWSSVGASTLHNMVDAGGLKTVHEFLYSLDLSTLQNQDFSKLLNSWTRKLNKKLGGDRWGPARKSINLFLRDATYNHVLRREFHLNEIECCLEIPLDSKTMNGIRTYPDPNALPLFGPFPKPAVKRLDHKTSNSYQKAALEIAKIEGINRVDLDLKWWSRQGE
jgi:hypothetical protein